MAFLKNRSFVVKVAKDQDLNTDNATSTESDRDPFVSVDVVAAYSEIAKDFVTHTALTIGGVFAACKIIERICK